MDGVVRGCRHTPQGGRPQGPPLSRGLCRLAPPGFIIRSRDSPREPCPLGIHLTVFDGRNYVPLSFAAGFVLGMLPGLGPLGAMVSRSLYSYLSWWFGRSLRDP